MLSDFFLKEDGDVPPIISYIHSHACGICIISLEQLNALVGMPAFVSQHECAALVVSDSLADTGKLNSQIVTFVAKHEIAGKILLKGVFVNFGANKSISVKKAPRDYDLQPKDMCVFACEIARGHCAEWATAASNPVRFIWLAIDKSQMKIMPTWSRRFFSGQKGCSCG